MAATALNRNMEEIRQIFVAECVEGLDVIETGLLDLEKGTDTQETINDIFRGAHSIKGGAATFGYRDIAEFTHVLETLLDRVRAHELTVTPLLVKAFLDAVDCLREMVEGMDEEEGHDRERARELQQRLHAFLDTPATTASPASIEAPPAALPEPPAADIATQAHIWDIHFRPHPEFMQRGNQPQHIFRALAGLGSVTLQADYTKLPDFGDFKPDHLYLGWQIELVGDTSMLAIREVFDWVELDADIDISEREIASPAPAPASVTAPANEGHPEHEEPHTPGEPQHHERKNHRKESASIRVDIEKIDVLLNLVGEMVINQAMLSQLARKKLATDSSGELEQGLALLERTTRELQEAVMEIRMLPVSVTFSRLPRLVYDLGARLQKKVELKITGEQTELDKTVLEKIGDPLLHLIRNSLDHGIELPEERLRKGKPETGVIHLSASHEGGSVVIRVTDDGAGLNTDKILRKAKESGLVDADARLTDTQIHDLIFHAGFSTADAVTDVSGRGVGMDVVRRNIEDIGGRVEVYSQKDKGSTFQITLPLTLAILDGQLIRVGHEIYVLPLLSIVETVQMDMNLLNVISGREVVYRLRGEAVPVVDMRRLYRIAGNAPLTSYLNKQLIIVESDRRSIGLVVDELLDQHQVVIKSLENNFVKIPGMLGATILGDGTVSLILDVTTLSENLTIDTIKAIKH